MGNFGSNSAAKGGSRECEGRALGGVLRGMSLGQGFEGGIIVELAGIIFGVPHHASLCSPGANIPAPTRLVPIFNLDQGIARPSP